MTIGCRPARYNMWFYATLNIRIKIAFSLSPGMALRVVPYPLHLYAKDVMKNAENIAVICDDPTVSQCVFDSLSSAASECKIYFLSYRTFFPAFTRAADRLQSVEVCLNWRLCSCWRGDQPNSKDSNGLLQFASSLTTVWYCSDWNIGRTTLVWSYTVVRSGLFERPMLTARRFFIIDVWVVSSECGGNRE